MPSYKKKKETRIHFEDDLDVDVDDDADDVFTFKTKRTFELLEHDEPFLQSQLREISDAGKEQFSHLKEDVKEMLEPVANGMEPCVGCLKDMIRLDWMPLVLNKRQQQKAAMVGPPSSLAAVARGQGPSSSSTANSHPATKLTARNNSRFDMQTLSSKESTISKMTPPRGNLSTISQSGTATCHNNEKATISCSRQQKKLHTRRVIPGRENMDKVKRRLMKPRTEKSVFERFAKANTTSIGAAVDPSKTEENQSARVYLVPQNMESPDNIMEESKKMDDDEEERTEVEEQAAVNDNQHISKATATIHKDNAMSDLPTNTATKHQPSGTRPESPIRLLSFEDFDEELNRQELPAPVPEQQIALQENDVTFQEELVGATESAIAAAELAIAAAVGSKLVCGTAIPVEFSEGNWNEVKAIHNAGTEAATPSVSSPATEETLESREIAQEHDRVEERNPGHSSTEVKRETGEGERDPVVSSNEHHTDVQSDKSLNRGLETTKFSSSFLDAVQSSRDTELSKSARDLLSAYAKPVLVSRRYLSDTSDEETDTSAHRSATTHSRGSHSYSDHTSQWDYDTSRHSAFSSYESSAVYSTDASSLLYSDRGGPSSSIGNSSSVETTDREGSTDEEHVPITRHKGLSSPFRTRALLPPRFRSTPKMF
jgi:hypothetical protein